MDRWAKRIEKQNDCLEKLYSFASCDYFVELSKLRNCAAEVTLETQSIGSRYKLIGFLNVRGTKPF